VTPQPEPAALTPSPSRSLPLRTRAAAALVHVGNLGLLTRDTARQALRRPFELTSLLEQIESIGVRSTSVVVLTGIFSSMVITIQFAAQLARFGAKEWAGNAVGVTLARELGPVLTALMVGGRVGAGIAAEIGSMVVTEQVDALRKCAADPIDFLVKPRFLASLVMTTVLIVWAGAIAFLSGAVTAYVAFDVPLRTFFNMSLVDWGDMSTGLAKCVAYGAAIPIVSGYCGLSTFGGSEGVGWATTRAVVNSSLAIIILNAFISTAGLMIFGTK
jgi:phospholipid/cholesterol/gamma-HCH transport system permease protein